MRRTMPLSSLDSSSWTVFKRGERWQRPRRRHSARPPRRTPTRSSSFAMHDKEVGECNEIRHPRESNSPRSARTVLLAHVRTQSRAGRGHFYAAKSIELCFGDCEIPVSKRYFSMLVRFYICRKKISGSAERNCLRMTYFVRCILCYFMAQLLSNYLAALTHRVHASQLHPAVEDTNV
jgi:hypothetical protein